MLQAKVRKQTWQTASFVDRDSRLMFIGEFIRIESRLLSWVTKNRERPREASRYYFKSTRTEKAFESDTCRPRFIIFHS